MTDIYLWPYFNVEKVEAECYPTAEFPIPHDIEYVGGIRVTRTVGGWKCEHGKEDAMAEGAAANCLQYCTEEPEGWVHSADQ